MRTSCSFVLALAATVLCGLATGAHAGVLDSFASCVDGTHIKVEWTFSEDPSHIVGAPEWVGYDVLRRKAGDCTTDYARLNTDPFPRVVGQTHSGSMLDLPPSTLQRYEYRVVPVDASHQPVLLGSIDCEPPCVRYASAACPEGVVPVLVGQVVDMHLGWTVILQSCAGSCGPSFYVGNPAMVAALLPHAGTGEVFAFWGAFGCGGIEGCGMTVDRFELTSCAPVPTRSSSWGRVKTVYR
jgi:hypothetical protein